MIGNFHRPINCQLISSFYTFEYCLSQSHQQPMDRFQHKMRTTQHAKSVQMIMTRTNYQFFTDKSPRKRPSPQGQNITTYLRKFQIQKENLNLAKRIMQCESEHSKEKYCKEWENIKRFLKVRSNFKKTLHAKQPQIFKFEPILGKGKLKVDFCMKQVDIPAPHLSKKNLYKFSFLLGTTELEPDKNLITEDLIKNYQTNFYAPLFLKKKKITSKLYHVHQNDFYEVGRFQIDLAQIQLQETNVMNRLGKKIGKVVFQVQVQGGRKKPKRKNLQDKENSQALEQTKSTFRQNYFSGLPF